MEIVFDLLDASFAVHRLDPAAALARLPDLGGHGLACVVADDVEVTVVCEEHLAVRALETSAPWRGLRIRGPLAFTEVGILARVSRVLERAGVPIFVASSYATDCVLVPAERLHDAVTALEADGMPVGP